jgi:hypothetical protein
MNGTSSFKQCVSDIYHTLHTFKRLHFILHLDLHATMMKQINQKQKGIILHHLNNVSTIYNLIYILSNDYILYCI